MGGTCITLVTNEKCVQNVRQYRKGLEYTGGHEDRLKSILGKQDVWV